MFARVFEFLKNLKPKYIYLVLFLFGGLEVLGLAPFFLWPIFAISNLIFFILIDTIEEGKTKIKSSFWRGWIFGFSYFLFGLIWMGAAFLVDAEKFAWLMPFAVTLLPACLATFYGLIAVLYNLFKNKSAFRVFWFAACYGFFEFLRGNILSGLPWNLPNYIWNAGGMISQSGALIGPYGVGLFTILIFTIPAIIKEEKAKYILAFGALVIGIALSYGAWRINAHKNDQDQNLPIIAVGHAGFSQKELYETGNEVNVARKYLSLLDEPEARNANIIVWPEGTFPFFALEEPELLYAINQKLGSRTLIFGAPRETQTETGIKYYNSIAWLRKGAGYPILLGLYDKYHLVPFGEYLPLGNILRAIGISSLVSTGADFTPGASPKIMNIPDIPPADPRVCYEVIFPNFGGDKLDKAEWILNISVDAWYGDFLGPDQHFNQARWRAIETGRPLVRSASGGWSGIVDSLGKTVIVIRHGPKMISARLPPKIEFTSYSHLGELWFCIALLLFSLSGIWFGKIYDIWLLTRKKLYAIWSFRGKKI